MLHFFVILEFLRWARLTVWENKVSPGGLLFRLLNKGQGVTVLWERPSALRTFYSAAQLVQRELKPLTSPLVGAVPSNLVSGIVNSFTCLPTASGTSAILGVKRGSSWAGLHSGYPQVVSWGPLPAGTS